jgi:hypothetical protein
MVVSAPLTAGLGTSFSPVSELGYVNYIDTFIFIHVSLFEQHCRKIVSISTRPTSFLFPTAERRTNKVIHNELLAGIAAASTVKAKS